MGKKKAKVKEELPRRDENGKPICGAKLKRGRGICKQPPMANGRCYHHGGASFPPGPGHPRWTDGRHSRLLKALPDSIARSVEEATRDPELLSIREDVALLDKRRAIIAERLGSGESGANWKALRAAWSDFEEGNKLQREAAAADDPAGLQAARAMIGEALDRLRKLITGGASEENRWGELIGATLELAELKQSETTRLQKMAQMMTMGEVALLIHQLQQAVAANITDQSVMLKIGQAFAHIMAHGQLPAAGDVAPLVVDSLPPASPPVTAVAPPPQ